jgi:hypothetical protein
MAIFKSDFCRFFALGFAGGAALVLAVIGVDHTTRLSDSLVTPAHAAQVSH